ncbi:helix-turn-helix transcriptional regulator [Tunturiibacter lichenicola]|jgi:transcriptional regulator with XRE-family HTH domain|uniref:helix-turn-helix transcriptional regulator n=1 Tax=Tunturiibacter lichenicola TaxID=2051959 RepID=UPI003D9B6E42
MRTPKSKQIPDIYAAVGLKIRELRASFAGKGLSQAELAQAMDTTPNTISRWETGVYRPSLLDIESIARFFGVPVERMLPQSEMPSQINLLLSAASNMDDAALQELVRFAHFQLATRNMTK